MNEWTDIYERHCTLVWGTAYRLLGSRDEALDCCQDVFVEVFRRPSCEAVRDWPAFLRWLATRRALDRLRRRRIDTSRFGENSDVSAVSSQDLGPQANAIFLELKERLMGELCRLPRQQAEAFWLRAFEQMSYDEIGMHMGIKASRVGVLVLRARQRLCEWLADFEPAAPKNRNSEKKR